MRKITTFLCAFLAVGFAWQVQAQSSFVNPNGNGQVHQNGPAGTASGINQRGGGGGGTIVITHSNSQNIEAGAGIACNTGNIANDNSFFRDFDLDDDFGINGDFEVLFAEFGVDDVSNSYDIDVRIWSSDGAFPGGVLTLLAEETTTIDPGDIGTVVSVPISAVVPAGLNMVYEVSNTGDGVTTFYLGNNNDGQTGPSWILAPDCGANAPTDLVDFGITSSFVMNVVGLQAGISCESTNYEATGLPIDIDGGDTSTADCTNAPNLVSVDVTNLGVIGEDAEIENLEFTITHTFDSDLDISLVSPAGTELLLSGGNGGSGDNYVATVFEDGGADITADSAPFTGTYEPEGGTFADAFAGESVSGTWSLKVCDNFVGDTGQIVAFELNLCAQPFNDICDDAYAVECGDVITGDTSAATNTVGNDAPDVFFSYTGTGEEEVVTLSLCDGGTDYDSFLWVFDDCDLTTLIAANDDSCGLQSELSFYSDGTSTYIIVVEGFGTQSGNFSLDVSCGPVTNDICQGAESISCGDTVAGTTVGANSDFVDGCGISVTAPGVWYTFTDDFGFETDYVVSTCDGTNYDSKLSVYVGDDCGNLVCVGGNDDTCGLQSEVAWTGDGSSTYYILVHGFGGASGDFNLNLSCTPIPPPNDEIANAIDVDEAGFPYTDPNVSLPAATTEDGNPEDCNIDGANGVWYKFTTTEAGQALAELDTPSGVSFVAFFEAPDEDSTEEELERVTQGGNQCLPSTTAFINTLPNQTYYVFVVNTGGASDVDINYDVELGIQENGIEGFTFSPNPTRGQVTLSALDQIERATIYNILGQAVLDRSIEATSTQLDVSNLSTGTYIMKVTVNGQVGTYKLIKQ
jgi:subtilisin-like proprotein convertase family protein